MQLQRKHNTSCGGICWNLEKEDGRVILAAINKIFGDIDNNELQIPESIEEVSDIMIAEWEDIRDDSELCYILPESEFEDVDVYMEEVDPSGNQHRNISSMIENLFRWRGGVAENI